jgi:hypothetical protein
MCFALANEFLNIIQMNFALYLHKSATNGGKSDSEKE